MLRGSRISGDCDTSAGLAMDEDTSIGGHAHRFPVTEYSAIIAARSDDQEVRQRAFTTIVESYWKPAYKYFASSGKLQTKTPKI